MLDWSSIRDDLCATSVKQRLHGLEALLGLSGSPATLSLEEFAEFVDQCGTLLNDSNFKVAQQTLQALSLLVCKDPDAIKPYANSIVPLVAERLADARQQVRQDACEVLLKLLAALKPDNVIPRLARFWTHRSWKVRHGVLQTIAEAVSSGIPGVLNYKDQNTYIITQVVNLVEDPNETVRDAALDCLQELYRALGLVLLDNLKRQSIRPAALREVASRLDQIAPCNILVPPEAGASPAAPSRSTSHTAQGSDGASRAESAGVGSGAARAGAGAASVGSKPGSSAGAGAGSKRPGGPGGSAGDTDAPAPPVTLNSERELQAELDGMMPLLSSLTPDWQQRIVAMAKLEGIARGSQNLAEALVEMLKPMRDALTTQIEDRRSAVNKQACRTLSVLSGTLGLKFQDHAIYFLPVVFRVLPITVQVMAEASDQCCQAILKSCQSHRLLPVLLQTASKDKNTKIRAQCCGYVAMVLEVWDAQVYLRCADDLEGTMRSAAQDASQEARQAARRAFAAYAAKSPDQASAFLQRLEPSLREKLSKGSAAGGDSSARPGSGASSAAGAGGAQRPRLARKPLPGFAGAKARGAAVAGSDDVLVFVAERPASASAAGGAAAGAGAGVEGSVGAVGRPWSAQQAPTAFSMDAAAAPGSGYGVVTVHATPTLSASMPAPLSKPPAGPAGSMGPPPRVPTAQGLAGGERTSASGAGGGFSQRGPYRSSAAAELPPMERLPQTAGGRKSIGGFGPSRVPGPASATSDAFAHALLHGGSVPGLTPGTDVASMSAAASAAGGPKLKAGRRSTGGIGLMSAGLGLGAIHQQALRIPTSDPAIPSFGGAPTVSGPEPVTSLSTGTSGGGGYAALAATMHAGLAGPVGSPARRVTVTGIPSHGSEGTASRASVGGDAAAPPPGSGRSTGSWGLSSGGSGGQGPVWGVTSLGHGTPVGSMGGSGGQAHHQQQQAGPGGVGGAGHGGGGMQAPPLPAQLSTKQSVSKVVTGLVSGPKTWSEKVQALSTLVGLLEQVAADSGRDQGSDCGRDLERLGPKLLEWVEDSHHKVAAAALEVLRAALRAQPRALDGAVERLMPAVFLRTSDAKDTLRGLASAALADCSASFPADVLLLGLARSLDTCKQPRSRIAVLEYACQHIGQGRPAGAPSNGALTKQWLRQLCGLLMDKNLDLRRAAVEAVEALHQGVDAGLVVQYASFSTGPEALALKRVLTCLSERLGGSAGSEPTAMEVDGVSLSMGPSGMSGGAADSAPGDVEPVCDAHGGGVGLGLGLEGGYRGGPSPGAGGGAKGKSVGAGYAPRDYMTPMRVDVERIADIGAPPPLPPSSLAPAGLQGLGAALGGPKGAGAAGVVGKHQDTLGSWSLGFGQRASGAGALAGVRGLAPVQAEPTMDLASASRHVSLLVYRLQMATGPEQEEEAWQRLSECVVSGQTPPAAWEGSVAQLRLSLGRALKGGAPHVRRAAAALVSAMAVTQPAVLHRSLMGAAVPALLAMAAGGGGFGAAGADGEDEASARGGGYKPKEVAKCALDTLTLVLEVAPAPASLELLAPHLPHDDSSAGQGDIAAGGLTRRGLEDVDPDQLAAVLRGMHGVLRRLDLSGEGAGPGVGGAGWLLEVVVPGLRCALGHGRADIRKASVFCLVELWCKLGEALAPHLAPLSEAQRKLVTIYWQRATGHVC